MGRPFPTDVATVPGQSTEAERLAFTASAAWSLEISNPSDALPLLNKFSSQVKGKTVHG